MFPINLEEEEHFFSQAMTWDEDRLRKAERGARKAWRVAFAFAVSTMLCAAACIVLVSSRQLVPFLVAVDKHTGQVQVLNGLANPQETYQDEINRYFLRRYMVSREAWTATQAQRMFDDTQIFNSPQQQRRYAAESNPTNPKSKSAAYGARVEVDWKESSISFVSHDAKSGITVAAVRWSRVVRPVDGSASGVPTDWLSTISFKYVGLPASAAVRAVNPLGMQVVAYRVDPDDGTAQGNHGTSVRAAGKAS